MQKRTQKHKTGRLPVAGLCTTVAALAGMLCVLALLVRNGTLSEELLNPALLLCCLLSAIAGCIVSRVGEGGTAELLLSGAVPAALLLCCGIVHGGGHGAGSWARWNAAALLLPCIAVQLLRGRKHRERRR